MDSVHLLIIDHATETAEQINSLLRNSGINIYVSRADTLANTEFSIKEQRPFLLIYNATDRQNIEATEALDVANKHGIPVAVRFLPSEPDLLLNILETHSCMAINADDGDQMITTVDRILKYEQKLRESGNSLSALKELEQRYNLLLESSRESIAYLHEGLHIYANRAYLDLMQVKKFDDIEAISLLEIVHSHQDDLKKLLRAMNGGAFPEDVITATLTAPSGDKVEVELGFSPARYDGEDCVQMMVTQIDAHATLKNEVARLRRTDQLTQLMNRQAFTTELQNCLQSKADKSQPYFVFYMEPDNASEMQGRVGTTVFDGFLEQFAATIRQYSNEEAFAARFSDFGFTLLFSTDSKANADRFAEQLRQRVSSQGFGLAGKNIPTTCSIGVASVGALTKNAEEAITQATLAYRQAAQENDCVKHYAPMAQDEDSPGDAEWAERIRFALNTNRLFSVQQSIINLEEESEGLYENKTFIHEKGGDLPADEFMFHAERSDLGSAIDRFVIPGLLRTIAGTGDRHIFNLSLNSILDFSFPSWFQHQISELGVEGSQIILQIESQAAASNLKPLSRLVDELKPLGCSFSLSLFDNQMQDDMVLEQLKVAMVKLPPGLSQSLASNSENQRIVRSVVDAANQVNADVIADEIIDAADLAVLWQCGVKLVAGEFLKDTSTLVAGKAELRPAS